MKKISQFLSVLFVSGLILAACGGGDAVAPAPTPTATPVAEAPATEEDTAVEGEEIAAEGEEMTKTEAPASAEAAASGEETTTEEPAAEATEETALSEAAAAEESTAAQEGLEAAGAVRTFVVVPAESKASYIVAEEFFGGALGRLGIQPGLQDTIGSTQEVSGEMQLDFSNLSSPVVSSNFEVNIRSLTSDQSRRDNAIRDRWLESNGYPLAEFTITSLENVPVSFTEGEEVNFQAKGDITVRELTQPTTFDVSAKLEGDTITGVATTQLTMTDFGFDPPNFANLFSVADDFTVQVEFTFKEQ